MFSESFSPKSAIVSIWRTRVLQIESSPNLYPTNFLALEGEREVLALQPWPPIEIAAEIKIAGFVFECSP